jgi:hypothetical protein
MLTDSRRHDEFGRQLASATNVRGWEDPLERLEKADRTNRKVLPPGVGSCRITRFALQGTLAGRARDSGIASFLSLALFRVY